MSDLNKVATTSESIENESLEKLRAVFPEFVKEGLVDFEALKAFFDKENISAGQEKYGLSWAGKNNAFQAIRTPSTGTLSPQREESKNWDDTENLFIEGDNLEVLKLLQKHYREKIKMIYIDPPYNTGKDFVYKDNFTQGVADYYEQTGQTQGGIKMSTNTEKNGRYHSDWLTMMYPRLFLARNLLKEDGVIFISIDDNEVANLRLIMDEIFGEENFIGSMIRKSKVGGGSDSKYIVKEHEYLIAFAKSTNNLPEMFTPHNEEYLKRYKEEDENGKYFWDTFARPGLQTKSDEKETLVYEIKLPDGSIQKNRWIRSKDRFDEDLENEEIRFLKKEDNTWSVQFKQYLNEDGKKPRSMSSDIGTTIDGKKDIRSIFNNTKIFSYPKPIKLIKFLANVVLDSNDIVLDFFAGSGTTGHAVMDLNSEDEGNRKWICVQLPEETDEKSEAYKAGYKSIAQISRERIRRAGEKIAKGDIGFKSYKLTSSNYRKWQNLSDENNEEDLKKQAKLFIEKPLVDNYKALDVVHEILLKEGFDLNSQIEERLDADIFDYYLVTDTLLEKHLYITFVDKVSQKQVGKLGLSQVDTFVCFDSALDDTAKVNIGRSINIKTI